MTEAAPPPAAPTNAVEARTQLDARLADKEWGERLTGGDVNANREFCDLTAMAARDDSSTVAAAMSGNIGDMPDSSVKLMANTADMLREIGVSEGVIEQTLRGDAVSAQEFKLVEAHKARLMKDPVFLKNYLGGDPEARQQMVLCNIVLTSEIKKDQVA
jgi:hypothetical protein